MTNLKTKFFNMWKSWPEMFLFWWNLKHCVLWIKVRPALKNITRTISKHCFYITLHGLRILKSLVKIYQVPRSFGIRVNFLHLKPSLFCYGLLLSLWCFSILVNCYFQVAFNLKVILSAAKLKWYKIPWPDAFKIPYKLFQFCSFSFFFFLPSCNDLVLI